MEYESLRPLYVNDAVADLAGCVQQEPGVSAVQSYTADDLALFCRIVDQAPDAIVVSNRQGVIQVWNKAAGVLLGYGADEAIGQSLDLIIPEHLRSAHWGGFRQAMASGVTKHGTQALRTRATHKTGRAVYLSIAFSVIKDQEGNVIGAMAMARESKE